MNIRISNSEIRFRVSEEEFQFLQDGLRLSDSLPVSADKIFSFEIEPASNSEKNQPLGFLWSDEKVSLFVRKNRLEYLKDVCRSKKGFVQKTTLEGGKAISLVLQIDLKS